MNCPNCNTPVCDAWTRCGMCSYARIKNSARDLPLTHIIKMTSTLWKGWKTVSNLYGYTDQQAEETQKSTLHIFNGALKARVVKQNITKPTPWTHKQRPKTGSQKH